MQNRSAPTAKPRETVVRLRLASIHGADGIHGVAQGNVVAGLVVGSGRAREQPRRQVGHVDGVSIDKVDVDSTLQQLGRDDHAYELGLLHRADTLTAEVIWRKLRLICGLGVAETHDAQPSEKHL